MEGFIADRQFHLLGGTQLSIKWGAEEPRIDDDVSFEA